MSLDNQIIPAGQTADAQGLALMNLYAVMIGGQLPGFRIEAHDIELHLARDEADLLDRCRASDRPFTARHIDGWIAVPVQPEQQHHTDAAGKVYLVELGCNQPGRCNELHDYQVIAASTVREAKLRSPGWHVDNVLDLSREAAALGVGINPQQAAAQARAVSRYLRF